MTVVDGDSSFMIASLAGDFFFNGAVIPSKIL